MRAASLAGAILVEHTYYQRVVLGSVTGKCCAENLKYSCDLCWHWRDHSFLKMRLYVHLGKIFSHLVRYHFLVSVKAPSGPRQSRQVILMSIHSLGPWFPLWLTRSWVHYQARSASPSPPLPRSPHLFSVSTHPLKSFQQVEFYYKPEWAWFVLLSGIRAWDAVSLSTTFIDWGLKLIRSFELLVCIGDS